MLERLRGLDPEEQTACVIAERALGAKATANDVRPKQGAVEAFLDYPDGRRGAFEVTKLATDGGDSLQLESLLARDGHGWPLPGKWWWTIKVGHPRDLLRLPDIYAKIILKCESAAVREPRKLPPAEIDDDVRWLIEQSSVRMLGYRDVLATDGYRMRRAAIDRFSSWGGSDESYSQLDEELSTAFNTTNIQRHMVKLRRMEADERHLFLILGVYDLPFTLFGSLASGEGLPTGAPALPEGLTHLWLAPEYCWRVLIGAAAGWTETRDIRVALDGSQA
jgi:hypothetical protein